MELNFPKLEKRILNFWKRNKVFEKSIELRKRAPNFVFYEGPPTANAKPGLHHVLTRVFKDIICRYKTMQGFRVVRKAGWDTHGLPVELEIEKKLGLKSKKDIEKYGIAKFNKKCRQSVWQYKKDWEKLTERVGFWLDMENPYITYMPDYIETVWWILKQIWQKGLLYQAYKVSPYCFRCQTVLSSHEVAQGYEKIKEPAIYVKLPILNPEFKNTFFLVWTTTPWTLPGNVAVAVNPEFTYVKVKIGLPSQVLSRKIWEGEEYLILAKKRMEICGIKGEVVKEFKGRDLVGLRYQPPYSFNTEIIKRAYRVIPADFVSLEEGTGLVHIAPAFGEEDMEAIKNQNAKIKNQNERLPILLTVDEEGKFKLEVKKWAGMFVKDADPKICEDLKTKNLLFKEELYEHDYPFCWRCHLPLLYYAKKSWFIRMTGVKKELTKNNQKINWIPGYLKAGRFGEWLREIKDWALSRERYWGTPLPVWQCKKCNNLEIIGSLKDLLNQNFSNNNYYFLRHGHSLRQLKGLAMCWPEKIPCPLTEEGEKEIKIAAEKLKKKKIDLIFSSDLLRTKQTAEIVARETGAKIIFDKKLREYNVGIFNGRPPHLSWQYLEKKKEWLLAKIPKGESLVDLRNRMYSFLEKINEKYQNKNILIVSHELPLTILEGTLKTYALERILELRRAKEIKVIKTGRFRKIEFRKLPFNEKGELNFHRPYIDELRFYCRKCGQIMARTSEVIDVWFDSGSMPFAQAHYPFTFTQNKKFLFPADYISEGVDQTRGWFYTLLAVSTILNRGPAYKNVISLGHVLDEKGEKMSKSKGNVVNPWYVIEKYGADATRWYFYTINQPGDSKLFSEKDVAESLRKFIMTFWNCYMFFKTYARETSKRSLAPFRAKNVLDKWITSKLHGLILNVTDFLDKYDVTAAARAIERFVINDLSLWYIRRSRKRFKESAPTLVFALETLSKLTAPFIPFLSEEIYRRIFNFQFSIFNSVHLEEWPKAKEELINKELEKKMEIVREVVAEALAERARAKIKVRQPLQKLKVKNLKLKVENELLGLIKEEINVKEIVFDPKIKKEVELDREITPELKTEGIIREIIRQIQEMRKMASLKPKDKVSVDYFSSEELNEILEKNKEFILREGNIKNLVLKGKAPVAPGFLQKPGVTGQAEEVFAAEKEVMVDQQKLWLAIYPVKNHRCQRKKQGN